MAWCRADTAADRQLCPSQTATSNQQLTLRTGLLERLGGVVERIHGVILFIPMLTARCFPSDQLIDHLSGKGHILFKS